MVKVSIIIPVYNPGKLFEKCIDSALNQTLKDIEVICINDGSIDGSIDILNENTDFRLKIFNQKNQGAGKARNKGIDEASGEFIIFLDADDWIENDMCEKLYSHAKRLNCDLVLFDTIWYFKNNKKNHVQYFNENIVEKDFIFNHDFVKDKIVNPSLGVIWSKFYKTSLIKENKIRFSTYKIYNDVVFHFKSMLKAERISYYSETFYHYTKTNQASLQNSFRWGKYESLWFYVMLEIRDFLEENNLIEDFKDEFVNYSMKSFKNKLDWTQKDYQEEYFSKIKFFYETMNLKNNDLNKLPFDYYTFYIHVINCNDYEEFKQMQDVFDGKKMVKT